MILSQHALLHCELKEISSSLDTAVLYLVSNYVDGSVLCVMQAMMEQMTVKLGELDQQLAIKDQTITQLQSVL